MLLARSARYKTGFYRCLAGFIEVGESAEDMQVFDADEFVDALLADAQ